MPRVKNLSPKDIKKENMDDFLKFKEIFSGFDNQISIYSHSPIGMKYLYGMSHEISKNSTIPKRLIEIAVVAASYQNKCKYCVVHHSSILADLGLDKESIANITELKPKGLKEVEVLVRDYALSVTDEAWKIKDNLFKKLKDYFSEAEIVELTMRIALTGLFNKVNQALEIDMEEGLMAELMNKGVSTENLKEIK